MAKINAYYTPFATISIMM